MSTITFPGLSTGIDTNTIIAQLMAVEKQTMTLYQTRQATWQTKQGDLNTLETKLSTLKTSVADLSNSDQLRSFSATTSDKDKDIVTADASYNAYEGNHSVVVNRLATADRWVHTAGFEYAEDSVGAGTFIYSYNHKETAVTTTGDTTLQDLADLINNDANNPGVTASLLYFNDKYHLVLSGNDAGSDYQITVNPSNTEVWQAKTELTQGGANATLSTKITELDQFGGTLSGNERIHITGKTHDNTTVDTYMDVNSNTKISHIIGEINDAFGDSATAAFENGKIVLTDNTSGTSQMTLSLAYNDPDTPTPGSSLSLPAISRLTQGGLTGANLAGFKQADFSETQSAQDSEIRVDGYPTPKSGIAEVQTLTATELATAGTFKLTYNGQITDPIAYDANTATIQAALEALSNVEPGDVTVGGNTLDAGGTMTFMFKDTAGDVNMISIDPSGLTPAGQSNYVMAEKTKGDNYGWIRRSSNTVDDVIGGVTLHLHNTGTADVTLTRDIESIKTKISTMVAAYNDVVKYISDNTSYDATTKKAGDLMGDSVVTNINSQLNNPLIMQAKGFIEDIDTFLTPGHIGLQLDKDGKLSFDTTTFDQAIAKNYMGTLALIGADKTGSSNSNTIKFYNASSNYTTAGSYDVQVVVSDPLIPGGSKFISSAQIRLSGESTYRAMTVNGNIITGNSAFDENGNPIYSENGLQLSVDLSQSGPINAAVRVKQGFAGALEDSLTNMLATTTGSIKLDEQESTDMIQQLQDKIDSEQTRLDRKQAALVAQYARLEVTLTLLQQQMNALGLSTK
jgi:flagellar hook-associated protein 2